MKNDANDRRQAIKLAIIKDLEASLKAFYRN